MWFGHRLYLTRRVLLPWMPPAWSCSTNGYAMVKSESTFDLLGTHTAASAWVDGAAPGEVLYLPDRLSMVNRTIASRSQLSAGDRSHPSTPAEMRRKLARYRRRYGRIDLSDAPWARPYVAMTAELTGELELRA